LFNLTFFSVLAGILGAKVLLIAIDWRTYLAYPREILGTLRTAGVLLGGVLAGAVTFVLYARRHGMPVWGLADAVAAPLALAQAMGRLGCFSAGCCWGVPLGANHPLAITFTSEQAHLQTGVPIGVPRLPVQLIEMAFDLSLCLLLTWLWRRGPRPVGTVFWTYLLLYSLGRSALEFWRADLQRGLFLGGVVSTSQLLGFAGALVAAVMLLRGLQLRRRASAPSA